MMLLQERYPITKELFEMLLQEEKIPADDHVQLLDGVLVRQMPQQFAHLAILNLLSQLFILQINQRLGVFNQATIELSNSLFEPDLCITWQSPIYFLQMRQRPKPADIALVIEVADSSYARDREWKYRLYAEASIPEYWILNIDQQQVEVFRNPQASGYQVEKKYSGHEVLQWNESVTGLTVSIQVSELFGQK